MDWKNEKDIMNALAECRSEYEGTLTEEDIKALLENTMVAVQSLLALKGWVCWP